MPKKPLTAYLSFANEIRANLKRKQPNASISDIMKAVSIEWAKLGIEQKKFFIE